MSRKPPKFSDIDKEWMKSRKDRNKKIFPEYHLIICEGKKTEPLYFEIISDIINNKYKGRIALIPKGKARGTLKLLDEAIKEHEKLNREIKHVWLVYDKDEFSKDSFDNTFYKCQEMGEYKGAKYHAIYSNECVELWFLLHFKYIDVPHTRAEYIEMLNEQYKANKLGKYRKNDEKTCEKLLPYIDTALENAKKLDDTYNQSDSPCKRNPTTKIYELIDILKNYLK